LLKKRSKIVLNASIKGQCSKNKFYGDDQIEALLSQLEGSHATALRKWQRFAWLDDISLEPEDFRSLWEAILLQRSRTAFEIKKLAPAKNAADTNLFRSMVAAYDSPNKSEVLELLGSGDIEIVEDPRSMILHLIVAGLQAAILISDLKTRLLRNFTSHPFLFGDAPVVLFNQYLRQISDRGVLGLQARGLQIFFPLDSQTCLMLHDSEVYSGMSSYVQQDVVDPSDVAQINALQLHHSENTLYFGKASDEEYVSDLWRNHRSLITPPQSEFHLRENWLVNGQRSENVIPHLFERQINYSLNLSFMRTSPVHASEYDFAYRSNEIVRQHEQSCEALKQQL